MFSTAKRLFKFNGYNVGIASVVDSHGSSFLQVALLLGNENPVATVSRLIPVKNAIEAEKRVKFMAIDDIPSQIALLNEYMLISKNLGDSLNMAKEKSSNYHPPAIEPQQKKSYKRRIR